MATPTKKKTPKSELDDLKILKNLRISDFSSSVFVKSEIPCVMAKFLDHSKNTCVGIFILCFTGIDDNSYEYEVSKGNDSVTITYRPPASFFDPSWLEQLDGKYDKDSACQQSFQETVDKYMLENEAKEVVSNTIIPMPFKIDSNAIYAGVNLHGDKYVFALVFSAQDKRVTSSKVKINSPAPRSADQSSNKRQMSPTYIGSDGGLNRMQH